MRHGQWGAQYLPLETRRVPNCAVHRRGETDGGAWDSLAAFGLRLPRVNILCECGCPSASGPYCSNCITRFGRQLRHCDLGHPRAPRPHAGADSTTTRAHGLGAYHATSYRKCTVVASVSNSPSLGAFTPLPQAVVLVKATSVPEDVDLVGR